MRRASFVASSLKLVPRTLYNRRETGFRACEFALLESCLVFLGERGGDRTDMRDGCRATGDGRLTDSGNFTLLSLNGRLLDTDGSQKKIRYKERAYTALQTILNHSRVSATISKISFVLLPAFLSSLAIDCQTGE